jgi:hypothetical protein
MQAIYSAVYLEKFALREAARYLVCRTITVWNTVPEEVGLCPTMDSPSEVPVAW